MSYEEEFPYATMRRELRRREAMKEESKAEPPIKAEYVGGTLHPTQTKNLDVELTATRIFIHQWDLEIDSFNLVEVLPFTTTEGGFWWRFFFGTKLFPFGGKRIVFIDSDGKEQYMCLKFT
jgi:hypothetical protein